MANLAIRHEVVEDLKRAPRQVQRQALTLIKRLEHTPKLGLPLDYLPSVGNLGECRKLYIGAATDLAPVYRAVYRLLPNEEAPKTVDVISVGPRADYEAYKLAVARLRHDI